MAMIPRRQFDRNPLAGWSASGLLHAGLLTVIGLIVAPVGKDYQAELDLLITPPDAGAELVTIDRVVRFDEMPAEAGLWTAASGREQHSAVVIEHPVLLAAGSSTSAADPIPVSSSASGAAGGATFFGTVAPGDRFVYILDVSPSMNARAGKRLERAVLELLRSVAQLREDQFFYVLVFGWQTRRMFDDRSASPEMAAATLENKKRLRNWLAGIQTIRGNRSPRGARNRSEDETQRRFSALRRRLQPRRQKAFFDGRVPRRVGCGARQPGPVAGAHGCIRSGDERRGHACPVR